MIQISVPDEPVAAARPRVAVRGGRAHGYTPSRTAEAVWRIRQAAVAAVGPDWVPLDGPLRLIVVVYVRVPVSLPKRDRLAARPTRRPDLDNYLKTCLDGLSPLWNDDSQVVEIAARKSYALNSSPRWELSVEVVEWP